IQTEAYSGRWGRLMLQPKAYNRDDNKGVKFYVDAVQLLGNDDSISKGGGSKGEAFSAVDDEDEDEDALD
ncbi:ssDNA-binding protein, partial [Stenotrophomonas maltophilia]